MLFIPVSVSSSGYMEYMETLNMTCTVPGNSPETFVRQRQCVYDITTEWYNIVGDDIECGGKMITWV